MKHLTILLMTLLSLVGLNSMVFAVEEGEDIPKITVPKSYISHFEAERIAVQDLKVQLNDDDLIIPGQNGMDIVVKRHYKFGGSSALAGFGKKYWYLEMPSLDMWWDSANNSSVDFGCLGRMHGLSGVINDEPLKSVGYASVSQLPSNYAAAFTNRSVLMCEGPNIPVVWMPDGKKLTFGEVSITTIGSKTFHQYLLSKTSDRFGNAISYSYADEISSIANNRKKLTKISRNDGQVVNFHYLQAPSGFYEFIDTITWSGKTIDYAYTSGEMLDTHTDAQGQVTRYTHDQSGFGLIIQVDTPEGLKAEYDYHPFNPDDINNGNLRTKTLTGLGLTERKFAYLFHVANGAQTRTLELEYNYNGTQTQTTEFMVDTTGGNAARYTSGEVALYGTLKSINTYLGDWGVGNNLQYLQHQLTYSKTNVWGYHKAGTVGCRQKTGGASVNQWTCATPYLSSSSTRYLHNSGMDTYTQRYTLYGPYGALQNSDESNDFSTRKRYVRQNHRHDVDKWILNLPTTTQLSSDNNTFTTTDQTTWHEDTNLPFEIKRHGSWVQRFVRYHADGQVDKVEFNALLKKADGSNSTTYRYRLFADYKRGIAQTITVPHRYNDTATASSSKVIDNNGWMTQETDFDGHIIHYSYDKIGRMTNINPADSSVSDVAINWTLTGGNSGQQLVKTERFCQSVVQPGGQALCGSGTTIMTNETTYNAALRKTQLIATDVASNKRVIKNWGYDRQNHLSYSTWPTRTDLTYDALKRLNSATKAGVVRSQTLTYQAGNTRKISDFEGHETTTTFLAYGQPEYRQAVLIDSPEDIDTTLAINLFGNITSIKQQGPNKTGISTLSQTQYHVYDSRQHLCKTVRNDVGTTVYNNNALGEVLWQAQGVSGSSTSQCTATVSVSEKVTNNYDNQGSLHTVNFADTSPDITYTRSHDGDIVNLVAGSVVQSYQYNSRHLLESESLNLDGQTFSIDYGYDKMGALANLTYPNGHLVSFAPNGFGQPTKATRTGQNYATGATYYGNGVLNTFGYGNGLTHKTHLNARKLPQGIQDYKGGFKAVDLSYSYDGQQNVTSITDSVNSAYSLTHLAYDDMDRLISTTGNSGVGSSTIGYDGLGNITRYASKGRNLDYHYDTIKNRLSSVSDSLGDGQYSAITYDTRGNVSHNGKRGFTYNRANQLSHSGSNNYLYDGFNRRVKKVDSKGATYSLYSQQGKLLFETVNGKPVNYIFLGDKLVAKEGVLPTNTQSASVHSRPFGESIEAPKDAVGYTGHKFDTDLGLNYMQARYYDPVLGRFMSNDPVGFDNVHNFNRYAYANNNPYRYVDPDGSNAALAACYAGPLGCVAGIAITIAVIHHGVKGTTEAIQGTNQFNEPSEPSPATEDNEKPRFITGSDGVVVDTESTPKGSYKQPDGGRTDVLQNEDHGAGRNHTHKPITNTNPMTGQVHVNGLGSGEPVSGNDVDNITSGVATPVKKGR